MHLRRCLPLLFTLLLTPFLQAQEKIRVVSLSTILTEIATQVGGNHVEVGGLVQAGMDPHEFQPKPGDLLQIAQARLILASGKHMEGYLTKLPESSGTQGVMVLVGDHFPSLKMAPEEGENHATDSAGLVEDPHWWHSIANMKLATGIVRDELIKLDPASSADYRANASTYLDNLDALQKWARFKMAELPRDHRKLITSHDAFQYFAREFGFTIYSIEGISTEDEPSNKKISAIIDLIKAEQVKAIFGEFGNNPKVTESITRESGAKIGGTLYADGLGLPGSEAATYDGMMRHNLTTVVEGLK